MEYTVNQVVTHKGRPAVIITRPDTGVAGGTFYGIRYTDVPQFEADGRVPGYPSLLHPARGSCVIAREQDLTDEQRTRREDTQQERP